MNKTLSFIGLAIVVIGAYIFMTAMNNPRLHTALAMVSSNHTSTASATVQGGYRVTSKPTISAQKIDEILCAASSPACGTGASLYSLGAQYGVDPAFAMAFFWHESRYGTQGEARTTLSLGNLRCENGYACNADGYAAFSSWPEGYKAWYELIAGPIYIQRGLTTVDTIIPVYAPPGDHNDDSSYIASVESFIDNLHAGR